MYLLLLLIPVICLTIIIVSMVGFMWALFEDDNEKLALSLFFLALAMVLPMLASVQALSTHTEENLVVTESGKVTEVINNVHSVDLSDGGVITYTDRSGQVGQIVTSIDRRVNVQNRHLYKK